MASKPCLILRVAVPAPVRRGFDYLPPAHRLGSSLVPGVRVRVPFGQSALVGVLLELSDSTAVEPQRLRPVLEVLDETPLLGPEALRLLHWGSTYYHHPIGEVVSAVLPVLLRRGQRAEVAGLRLWRLTPAGLSVRPEALRRAPRQAALLEYLSRCAAGVSESLLAAVGGDWRGALRALAGKGWVDSLEGSCLEEPQRHVHGTVPELNGDQRQAVESVLACLDRFRAFLLDGVTGSGKTEVYLQLIDAVVQSGRQVLVLVPEIGLTPQLLGRFRRRLRCRIAVLHSGLSERERLCAWLMARSGAADVVIGTRSAVFTPLRSPGLFIVDEEHDASFKQQEGFRYSARDVAVMRARDRNIPAVLGSATPSLETLHNMREGRYGRLVLPGRAGGSQLPELQVLDVRRLHLEAGLSQPLLAAVGAHLSRGDQVLLFLNRRGYAPVLICHACGWLADCQRCDARMTYHKGHDRLRCHHCGSERPTDRRCPTCQGSDLRPLGQGTERIEQVLIQRFPEAGIARIDRDNTRRKGALDAIIGQVRSGELQLLIGTQMLAKGHHFPGVTLVGIIDADSGLFSADFRGSERVAQLITQVAGRAGRADKPGRVLIQTHHPEHPLLNLLIHKGYGVFADAALEERREVQLPPFVRQALLRAEATDRAAPPLFLHEARTAALALHPERVEILGPVAAPMERRAGRYRAQLLVQAHQRRCLHEFLEPWVGALEALKSARKVRWSLDVDPQEMF